MPMSRSYGVPEVTSAPLISSWPPSATVSPAIRLSSVVLPEPDGPEQSEELALGHFQVGGRQGDESP